MKRKRMVRCIPSVLFSKSNETFDDSQICCGVRASHWRQIWRLVVSFSIHLFPWVVKSVAHFAGNIWNPIGSLTGADHNSGRWLRLKVSRSFGEIWYFRMVGAGMIPKMVGWKVSISLEDFGRMPDGSDHWTFVSGVVFFVVYWMIHKCVSGWNCWWILARVGRAYSPIICSYMLILHSCKLIVTNMYAE